MHSNKQLVNGYYAFPNLRCYTLVYIFLTANLTKRPTLLMCCYLLSLISQCHRPSQTIKNTPVSHTVAVRDVFRHRDEQVMPTYTLLLLEILIRAPCEYQPPA